MKTIETYAAFNERRYGQPWVAIVDQSSKTIDFMKKVGGYTGKYGRGEAGELVVFDPEEGAIYAYGQKDYRGNNTDNGFAKVVDGEFIYFSSKIDALKHGQQK